MIDSQAHSLLNASGAALPDESYLFQVQDPAEMQQIIQRLRKLEQLYINDEKIHTKIDELLRTAQGCDHLLHMRRTAQTQAQQLGRPQANYNDEYSAAASSSANREDPNAVR